MIYASVVSKAVFQTMLDQDHSHVSVVEILSIRVVALCPFLEQTVQAFNPLGDGVPIKRQPASVGA
ncbi:hypothetical protein [Nitrobacter sp.]|uniref:hypothetical protein n=1 Tax=Nitrobacter sp. TaxID=29420 RepID=UPI00399D77B4